MVLRTYLWVAGLRGQLQCIFVWSGRGYCWQKQGVHPNSVPVTMALGHHNIKSVSNPNEMITNSDVEMAGLLLLLLVMEEVVCNL